MATSGVVPADVVQDLTARVWCHVLDGSPASLTSSPELHNIIGRCESEERRQELWAFVERLSALRIAEQREFVPAIDDIQVRSKLWLIEQLCTRRDLKDATILILGAWFGVLPLLLNWRLAEPPRRMICVDISADACALGRRVTGALYSNVKYEVADAFALDYSDLGAHSHSVLVNTICEHLINAGDWWTGVRPGQLSVLQSNNYEQCRDHVNCVRNLEEMKAQTPLAETWFEGVLPLSLFDRFMLIGRK